MNKLITILSIPLLAMSLASCSSMKKKPPNPLKQLEARASTNQDFTVGLALAGGGAKAANFSMGVLQGLSETKVIDRVDAISSVSGGGYAALWFYSRLLNYEKNSASKEEFISKRVEPFFKECLQDRYKMLVSNLPNIICENNYTFFSIGLNNPKDKFQIDPYRHQNYLRGYQDIFSSGYDMFGNPAFNMESTEQKERLTNDIGQLAVKTAGAALVNFIPNILFDWEIPLSPSRAAYDKGIIRTFGAEVKPCENEVECENYRIEGNVDWVKRLRFEDLRRAYEAEKVPLWIINTTAGESRQLLNFGEASPLMLTSYEMTPYGAGSGLYGYCDFLGGCKVENIKYEFNERLPEVEVSKAVIMSAAFFDEQQRSLGARLNGITKPLQSLSTLNWGISRKNPRVSDTQQVLHKILPWPFYYFHRYNDENSVNIRFSDGGQSENTGAYALIRRQMTDIIISDHSQDREGRMADICHLKNNLASIKDPNALFLHIPGLMNLNEVCNKGSNLGYKIFDWKHPILLGCVSKSEDESSCTDDNKLMSRLYIIKPAIPKEGNHYTKLGEYLPLPIKVQKDKSEKPNCIHLDKNEGYKPPENDITDWPFEEKFSCELVGFWNNNAKNSSKGINKKDNLPYFPQHSTAGLALNSSNTVYGAYRELARYYSRQLAWFFGDGTNLQLVKTRFKNVIEYQLDSRPGQDIAMKAVEIN